MWCSTFGAAYPPRPKGREKAFQSFALKETAWRTKLIGGT